MKELWAEHRHTFAFITYTLALVLTPALAISDADTWITKLIFLAWMLIGVFVSAVMLSVLIEMEVDKRLKEKD